MVSQGSEERLRTSIEAWRADPGATYRTWFLWEERLKNFRSIRRGIEHCSAHFLLLDRWLEGRLHMLGDDLSLADIAVGTTLYRYFNLGIPRPDIPNVQAWYGRLRERDPYRDHVMVPFDDLKGRLAY